jgi:DnaJ-domain-containing protein 1
MRKPLTPEQIEARKQYQKEWREANKDKISQITKEYYEAIKDKIKEYKQEYDKEYAKQNKEK